MGRSRRRWLEYNTYANAKWEHRRLGTDLRRGFQVCNIYKIPCKSNSAIRHLKPQIGWLEQVEIDYEPRCDDNTIPQFADIKTWYRALESATNLHNRPIRYNHDTREMLENQGFVDIHEETIRLPLNPSWEQDPHLQDIGRWYNLGLTQGLQALTLAPLRRKSNWTRGAVDDLVDHVRREVCSRKLHIYHEM